MRWVIFSDLDGSFLNYDDYSSEEAKPALEKIRRREIPLILTTSKTRTEVEFILGEMGLEEPFIIENGGAWPVLHFWLAAVLCLKGEREKARICVDAELKS